MLEMVGLTYHAHVSAARIRCTPPNGQQSSPLTQRERQCHAWISDGKTMQDIAALLGVTPRGISSIWKMPGEILLHDPPARCGPRASAGIAFRNNAQKEQQGSTWEQPPGFEAGIDEFVKEDGDRWLCTAYCRLAIA
jgi:DNA-binding CsgD family transcriptional regulator